MEFEHSRMAMEAFAQASDRAANQASQAAQQIEACATEPSVLYRPAISIDGNQWCALYGDNLQDGVAGFGDSPAEAMADFNKSWRSKLPVKSR